MSINIRTDFMQHAELFGSPVLFTNWLIQRDTIPKDWYCYDLRGTRQSPNVKIALVDKTARYHAGTVLSPTGGISWADGEAAWSAPWPVFTLRRRWSGSSTPSWTPGARWWT